jgi:nucleoside-diphosphate-sugar epimerase
MTKESKNIQIFNARLIFILDDVRNFFKSFDAYLNQLETLCSTKLDIEDVFHFAAVVGGRLKIENDPLAVAIDLSIDAEFFNWAIKVKPKRVLYPSSSAAYPTALQTREGHRALKESDIRFDNISAPDMSYGWAKLTGEYLARTAAQQYGLHVTCIRPFSGYGPDQDLDYPIPAIVRRFALREDPIEVWGDGTQSRDFIYIDDVIDGTLKAMKHIGDGSAVNLGSGKRTSFLEVIATLSEITSHRPKVRLIRDKPVGVYARYCDKGLFEKILNYELNFPLRSGLKLTYQKHCQTIESTLYQ